jgi:hypothetical protein
MGWRVVANHLNCQYCGRDAELNTSTFDLVEEHRYFCKWVNNDPNKQSTKLYDLGKLYGYGILV